MKKTTLLLFSLFCSAFMVACNETKPEFTFDFEIAGQVDDAKTNIASTFEGKVSNSDLIIESRMDNVQPLLTAEGTPTEQGANASEWMDEYFNKNFEVLTTETTKYHIHIVGFVHEKSTGLTFSINKIYTNTDSLLMRTERTNCAFKRGI